MTSTFIEGNHNSGLVVGANSGTINFTHPATQPESRPEPLMTVPFAHDPDFVTRDQLDQLHKKSSIVGSRTALVGLGGVGKSRLAIEYCHRVQQQLPKTWIFWVHASNAARCEQSLRDLADRAKIPGRQDRNTNIFQLFANWLKDGKIGQWILVLDNVDDDTLLSEPSRTRVEAQAKAQDFVSMRPPLRYLLDTSNGSIIITSRDKGVALKATGTMKHLIDVQPMNMTEALRLMQRKLDPYAESTELVQLIEELEFMPLAIVQAASYIIHHSPRCSVSQYLAKLRHSERQARTLLNREEYDAGRDSEAKNSISLTWQISFDHIRQIRQSAADLLSLMSFFDRQGIPEDVLRVAKKTRKLEPEGSPQDIEDISSGVDTDSSSELDDDDDFESDIATLRDYSLIATGENDVEFTMHRLVQLTVRTWLKMHGLEEEWKERFISNLHGIFPTGDYENWEQCRSLFPHVRSTILHRPKSDGSIRTWADLLYRGAWYALVRGNFVDSREMAALSRKQMLKLGGAEDKDALKSTAILAMAYREEGRWGEAEQLFAQVMETSKTKLGVDHPDTLTSIASLASTYRNQGRWEEAEQLEVQVMETRKTKLGADHPNTLTSMASLASTYRNQGRWKEAEQLFAQVMETRKTKLGVDHPDTLTSIASLASILYNQGRWEEAEQLEVQVMETCKTKLGADHPSTLTIMANLASTLLSQGRWEEAEQLFAQVMETRKTKLGVDHPDTLANMASLASTLLNQGRWGEAEQLFAQVIETRKTKLGADHPHTLTSIAGLASTLLNQGRWGEAEQLFAQVIETSKTKLGADHHDTLMSMANLASTLWNQGRWGEAEQLEVQVMETRKTKLGADHPDTLTSMANLASTLCNQGRWEEAEQLEVQVMETRKTKLGADHPNTLTSMANLAFTWKSIGRSADAIDLLKTCVLKQEQILGLNHPHTLSSSKILLEWETRSLPMRHDQISVSQFAFCLVLASLYLAISLQVRLD